ncbi:MAG: HEAT repeat domain-containing protein [Ignavibacteriaceae bacterium]|nr:HEAT repeat domain-containing protein [Ignavibacteriaceae bacterium]
MKLEVLLKTKLALSLLSLLFITTLGRTLAQPHTIKNVTDNKYALVNLLDNIKSENDGVKRSSLYFVGYYRITEAEDAVIEQLKKEQNPSNRILIALVLHKLGSEDGLLEVKKLASNDDNKKVRRMSSHIYNEYLIKNSKGRLALGN